jgi:dTDP-4-amino-4,6-dideoxygalactose transaminase
MAQYAMKPRAIHAYPAARLRLLAQSPNRAMARAIEFAPHLYSYSRDALQAWFHALGPRNAPVWMPAFHCGMEVRAAVDAGFTPRFYGITPELHVDEDRLAAGLREHPGPVLLIHYFGFPQPSIVRIAALCGEHGVPLLEDCSHALFSTLDGQPLGSFGQAASFSLYKTLGTVDGGALRAAAATTLAPTLAPQTIPWDAYLRAFQRRRRGGSDSPAEFAQRVAHARQRIFQEPWRYGCGISRLSLALLRRMDPQFVLERRRANYEQLDALLRGLPGYRPAYRALPAGTCPLYLPVFVRHRDDLLLRLQAAHVEGFIFGMFHHPAMDPAAFPESGTFREDLLCLPVHQDLDPGDVDRMASLLRSWLVTGAV